MIFSLMVPSWSFSQITGGADSPLKIIVGVGINVNMSAKQGSVIERVWTDLSSIDIHVTSFLLLL